MGTSPDSRLKTTVGRIAARLKCLPVVDDAEWSVEGLLASVQMFATRPIRQTAGMVIIEERYQPLIQPLHDGSYHRKPLLGFVTTYIICLFSVQGAVYLLPLLLQPDRSHWYLSTSAQCNSVRKLYANLPDPPLALASAYSTSGCSQPPLQLCKVLSDCARAFSRALESTCSDGGAFRMLRDVTFRRVKFWSC